MILILSNKYDLSVDYVVRLLTKRKEKFLRLNTEDLIMSKATIDFPKFAYKVENKSIQYDIASKCKSVWFRRPGKPFEFYSSTHRPDESIVTFAENQWHTFIEGLKGIKNLFWLNDPDKNHIAENKIIQLNKAQEIGLRIPKTCITNSKSEAIRFIDENNNQVVAKALSLPLIEKREQDYFIFTNIIDAVDDIPEDEFNISPTIFQELLMKKIDYRVTIVGENCFSVKVIRESNKGVPTDWRLLKKGIRFMSCEIPSDIEKKCVKIVKEFGLVFGAIDLVKTSNGFYFLEINPNGEWAWLQKEAKLPIAEAIVDTLIHGGVKQK